MSAKKFGMHSLHVKNNTVGTSNEISFSVLDAKKQQQDSTSNGPKHANPLGKVALFSLPAMGRKKIKGAPKREEGLHLSTGEFVAGVAENDPTGTTTLGSNAISGGTAQSGFSADLSGSPVKASKRISLGNGNGGGSSSEPAPARQLSPEEKAARQRTARRVGIVAAVCALITVAAFSAYNVARGYYEDFLINQSYQQILASSLSAVVEADNVLSEVDESLENMLGDESLAIMREVQGKLPDVTEHLDRAETLALRAQSVMTDQNDLKMAQNALDTITARRTMLSVGTSLIEETLSVAQEAELLKEVEGLLKTADTSTRVVVSGLSPLDATSVLTTAAQAAEVIASFSEAQDKITALENTYSDLDLSAYSNYIDLRCKALNHLIASCEAIEAEEIDTATAETALYNQYDSNAVKVASGFVAEISTLATDPYFQVVDQYAKQYQQAASKAATLDTALREYLRTTSAK